MPDIFFTCQVILCREDKDTNAPEAHEFKDCTADRAAVLRNEVWTKGLRINHSPTCWEIVSPFMIKQFFIIQQDKKYSV